MEDLETENQILREQLKAASHDAWLSQTMIAAVLSVTGPVTLTPDVAGQDFSDRGIDIVKDDKEDTLTLFLVNKSEKEDQE